MPYLGNIPAENYASFDKQTITGNGGTSYTLDHPVGSAQEVAIFVNNVRQEPGVAYTVTGTALTMTGNVESSDDFYAIFIGKSVQTVEIPEKATNGDYDFDNGTLFVDASTNRVGIGNTTPSDKLVIQEDSTAIQPLVVLKNDNTTADNGMSIDFSGKDTSSNNITFGRIDLIIKNHATEKSDMRFYTRNDSGTFTTQLTLSKDENAIFKGGISMNGETSASNTLGDYEEGTWTPALAGSASATIDDAVGQYVKIGSMVYFSFRLDWSSGTSMNNRVGGLPFTVDSSSPLVESDYWMSVTPYVNEGFGSLPSGKGYINGYCARNDTEIYFTFQPNTSAANMTASGNIYCTGYYKANT